MNLLSACDFWLAILQKEETWFSKESYFDHKKFFFPAIFIIKFSNFSGYISVSSD